MFKILFRLKNNTISHSLETKIQVVILMAKYESLVMIIRQLQTLRNNKYPRKTYAITAIYQNFAETDSVGDLVHTGRTSTSKSLFNTFLKMKQSIDRTIFKC